MNIDFAHPMNTSAGISSYTWAQADYILAINTGKLDSDAPFYTYNAGEYIQDGTTNLQTFLRVPTSHVWDLWPLGTGDTLYKWSFGEKNGRFGNLWRSGVTLGQVTLDYDRFTPFQSPTVRHSSVCVMNPCLREYAVSVRAGRVETAILSTEYGVLASNIPGFNTSSDAPVTTTCWAGNYTNITSAPANPFDESSLPLGASFCDGGEERWTLCDVDTEYIICDSDALRQAQMVTEAVVGNKSETSCLQGPKSAFFSMNKTDNPVHVQNASQFSDPPKLSYIVPWDWRNYAEEQYSSSAYRHALFSGNGTTLETTLENIAASLSIALQTSAGSDSNGARVFGQTAVIEAYVHVRWLWIIYPAIILAIGIFFVLWTIIATSMTTGPSTGPTIGSGRSLWKSSTLALVYHGPANLPPGMRAEAENIEAMERMAKHTRVRFDHGQMVIIED